MYRVILFFLLFSTLLFSFENSIGTLGYGRLQTSLQDGKEQVCFKAPGAGSKYRLGNECEAWVELGFFQNITFDNGVMMHNQVRPIFLGANNERIDFYDWAEVYSEISNVLDNSAVFWIGRRFNQRYDSHLSDYWFLNMSGDGAGVNNYNFGTFTFSYNFIYDKLKPNSVDNSKSALLQSHDIRLMKAIEGGEFTLFLNYMALEGQHFNSTQKVHAADGYAVGLIYKDKQIFKKFLNMEGENVSGIFYGTGMAKNAGAYIPYLSKQFEGEQLIDTIMNSADSIENSKTLRFVNYNAFENDKIGIMTNFVYEYRDESDFSGLKQEWISLGVRPYWFVHQNARLLLEAGYDYVDNKSDDISYSLTKITTAFELAMAKGVWERPVLRLYYTHANWSESARGMVGTSYYADKTSGDNFGIQLEYWW